MNANVKVFISSLLISANYIIHAHVKMGWPHVVLLQREPRKQEGLLFFWGTSTFLHCAMSRHWWWPENIHYQNQHYPVWRRLDEHTDGYLSTRAKFAGQSEVKRNRSAVPKVILYKRLLDPSCIFKSPWNFENCREMLDIINRHSAVYIGWKLVGTFVKTGQWIGLELHKVPW